MKSDRRARLGQTRAEFSGWLDERLVAPLSEYKPLDIDAIEAEYMKKNQKALAIGFN